MNKKRNANMELLRILSMLMVTMLHALDKSGLLVPLEGEIPGNAWIAWILEVLSIGAVNIFMLISGYFLVKAEFKLSRLLEIVCQVCFYALGAFGIFYLLGLTTAEERDVYHLLHYIFPVHMNVYWFITSYVVIYALLPVLGNGIRGLEKKQLRNVILILLVYECVFKSVLPAALEADSKGYSPLWYLIMFLLGAYFRLHGFQVLNKSWKGWIAYLTGSMLVLLEAAVLYRFHESTDHFEEILKVSTHYNHLFVVLAAVGIFAAFVNAKPMAEGIGKVVCAISPYALGVYLFQENITLRYRWQKWFGLTEAMSDPAYLFLLRVFGAVLAIFVIGSVIDAVRRVLFTGVAKICKSNKS